MVDCLLSLLKALSTGRGAGEVGETDRQTGSGDKDVPQLVEC